MDIKQLCFFSLVLIMGFSSAYLIYLSITTTLPVIFKFRFINFLIEHILGIGMLIKRQYYCNEQDTYSHLKWMIGFTGINFLNFVAVQIYGVLHHDVRNAEIAVENAGASFIALSYCHLYFQVNIYLGVFCLFSMIMGVVFILNQRRHAREVEEVLQDLQTQKYDENGKEQNCSICLAQFQQRDNIYKLVCGHVFHKQCLKDWFKQKLTCPMCRNNVGRPVAQEPNSELLYDSSSFDQSDQFSLESVDGNYGNRPLTNAQFQRNALHQHYIMNQNYNQAGVNNPRLFHNLRPIAPINNNIAS